MHKTFDDAQAYASEAMDRMIAFDPSTLMRLEDIFPEDDQEQMSVEELEEVMHWYSEFAAPHNHRVLRARRPKRLH